MKYIEREFCVTNQYGIHARPSALIVKAASKYDYEVRIRFAGREVNAKQIMEVLTLEAGCGSMIKVLFRDGINPSLLEEICGELQEAVTHEFER